MALAVDEAFDAYNAERLHAADTLLDVPPTMGSRVSGRRWQMIPPAMVDQTLLLQALKALGEQRGDGLVAW